MEIRIVINVSGPKVKLIFNLTVFIWANKLFVDMFALRLTKIMEQRDFLELYQWLKQEPNCEFNQIRCKRKKVWHKVMFMVLNRKKNLHLHCLHSSTTVRLNVSPILQNVFLHFRV